MRFDWERVYTRAGAGDFTVKQVAFRGDRLAPIEDSGLATYIVEKGKPLVTLAPAP